MNESASDISTTSSFSPTTISDVWLSRTIANRTLLTPMQKNWKEGQTIWIEECARSLPPFLNRDVLKWPIKAAGTMIFHIQKVITHYNETNDEIFNIDINVWNITRNVMVSIS
jgi:hypothetical protein